MDWILLMTVNLDLRVPCFGDLLGDHFFRGRKTHQQLGLLTPGCTSDTQH